MKIGSNVGVGVGDLMKMIGGRMMISPVVGVGVIVSVGGTTLMSTKKEVPWWPWRIGISTPAGLRSFQ